MHKQSFTFTHLGQPEVFLAQRRTLTRQDDVTGAEQTQTIQQVDQLADLAFPAPPLVHHPSGSVLLLLSQLHGGLIAQDLRGYRETGREREGVIRHGRRNVQKIFLLLPKQKHLDL